MEGMTVFEHSTLANGIRVLTAPMPHAQSVSCFIVFAAGSRYEARDGQVYSVEAGPDGVTVEVAPDPHREQASVPD